MPCTSLLHKNSNTSGIGNGMMNSPPPSHLDDSGEGDISLLLSPTKARQAAVESASWKYVDVNLQSLFAPKKVPCFERNDATLKALLELVKANENAAEERRILHEARLSGLHSARATEERSEGSLRKRVLHDLEGALSADGKAALDDLSSSAVLLSCSSGSINDMESRIMDLTRDKFDAENELLRLQQTNSSFDREIKQLHDTIADFKASTDPDALKVDEMQRSTATLNRETKVISMKLLEYQDRIRSLQNYDVGSVRIEDVVGKEEEIGRSQDLLKGMQKRIREMSGLPPDLDLARREAERARGELGAWKERRERAFEGLVG